MATTKTPPWRRFWYYASLAMISAATYFLWGERGLAWALLIYGLSIFFGSVMLAKERQDAAKDKED